MSATIYHGTPMSPRAALTDVCTGRAMCVSFFRPDDVEVVQAISPAIMFRQRRILGMESGNEAWRALVYPRRLDAIFRLARTAPVRAGALGSDPRRAGCAKPAQRQPVAGLAVRRSRCAALAHGRANRAPASAMRQIQPGLSWLDRRGEAPRHAAVPRTHGAGCPGSREPMAGAAHDARNSGRRHVPLCQRGRHNACPERMAL